MNSFVEYCRANGLASCSVDRHSPINSTLAQSDSRAAHKGHADQISRMETETKDNGGYPRYKSTIAVRIQSLSVVAQCRTSVLFIAEFRWINPSVLLHPLQIY